MDMEEKKFRLHTFAERGWRLAVDIALEGLLLAEKGEGLAVVADETRRMSSELEAALETGMDIGDLLEKFTLLSINGTIEALHAQSEAGGVSSMPLLLGELRLLMDGVSGIFGLPSRPLAIIPEPSRGHPVLATTLHLFHMSRGGISFAENLRHVREVAFYDCTADFGPLKNIMVRGRSIPVADVAMGLVTGSVSTAEQERAVDRGRPDKKQALIVRADWAEPGLLFAVPVDALAINCIARCRLGASSRYSGAPLRPALVRDAWDAPDGQILFPDWRALAGGGSA